MLLYVGKLQWGSQESQREKGNGHESNRLWEGACNGFRSLLCGENPSGVLWASYDKSNCRQWDSCSVSHASCRDISHSDCVGGFPREHRFSTRVRFLRKSKPSTNGISLMLIPFIYDWIDFFVKQYECIKIIIVILFGRNILVIKLNYY